jgi:hypothetical protein
MEQLVKQCLHESGPNQSSSLINGLNIVIELIRKGTTSFEVKNNNQQQGGEAGGEVSFLQSPQPMFRRDALTVSDVIDVLIEQVGSLKQLIEHPRKQLEPVDTTLGKQSPLGIERLTVMELLAQLLHFRNNTNIFNKYHECEVFVTALDLFFQFPWNNLLHALVYDMILSLFDAPRAASQKLIVSVSSHYDLI